MGNHKFRFSDILPNSWFYKLRNITKHHKTPPSPPEITKLPQRKSYYFTRDPNVTADPPRKSSKRPRRLRRSTKRHRPTPIITAGCSCRATIWANPDSTPSSSEQDSLFPECGSVNGEKFDQIHCECNSKNDVVIEIDGYKRDRIAPIVTKGENREAKFQRTSAEFSEMSAYGSLRVKVVKEDFSARRNSSSSPGVKLRKNSPRIANSRRRRSISDSFAVVKSTKDPRRDFMESMVEMIVENNIRAGKDLEELLACYLSLNSDEYHDLIINVFKQIWVEFFVHLRLN